MDKRLIAALIAAIIAAAMFFALTSLSGKSPKPVIKPPANYTVTNPNATDEHGCIISEGYTWCEYRSKCLKTWEETCEPAPFGKALGEAINLKWGFGNIIYANTQEIGTEGWLRGSLTVPEGAEFESLCSIFMRGNLTRRLDDGTTLVHHEPVTIGGKQVCEVAVTGGQTAPCGDLTLRMDLESMKAGYDKTRDNWQDFFTCSPEKGTPFCQAQCAALMDTLMFQKREPMAA